MNPQTGNDVMAISKILDRSYAEVFMDPREGAESTRITISELAKPKRQELEARYPKVD
jgi:hypothetical protein